MRYRSGLGDSYTALPQANDGSYCKSVIEQQEAIDGRLSRCDAMRSGGLDPYRLHVQVFFELLYA